MEHEFNMRYEINKLLSSREWVCALCSGDLSWQVWELKRFYDTPKGEKPFKKRTLINIDMDHVIPRTYGGVTEMFNLQLTHKTCNSQKGHKLNPKMRLWGINEGMEKNKKLLLLDDTVEIVEETKEKLVTAFDEA